MEKHHILLLSPALFCCLLYGCALEPLATDFPPEIVEIATCEEDIPASPWKSVSDFGKNTLGTPQYFIYANDAEDNDMLSLDISENNLESLTIYNSVYGELPDPIHYLYIDHDTNRWVLPLMIVMDATDYIQWPDGSEDVFSHKIEFSKDKMRFRDYFIHNGEKVYGYFFYLKK